MVHKVSPKKEEERKEKSEAEEYLRKMLAKGNYTVYTKLNKVSSSGMMRHIETFVIVDNKPVNITWAVAKYQDYKRAEDGGLRISGAGMDMGFSVVYSLSEHLFRTPEGKYSHEGAYKLKQEWL